MEAINYILGTYEIHCVWQVNSLRISSHSQNIILDLDSIIIIIPFSSTNYIDAIIKAKTSCLLRLHAV